MLRLLWLIFTLSLLSLLPFIHGVDTALRCKDHPAYSSSLKPVLISSWEFSKVGENQEEIAYLARYTGHEYAPVDDPSSNMYKGLDLFHKADDTKASPFLLNFQRGARVYMFVNVDSSNFDASRRATLKGWTSMGWAELQSGGETITYGIHETLTRKMPKYAYVFMKKTDGADRIFVPQITFVRKKVKGISTSGLYNLWIAEADGSASSAVGTFRGTAIKPNTQCPQALHDVWKVRGDDPNDAPAMYSGWHPAWDPCFWCAYDHEHGSNPMKVMGYVPKFTYTTTKFGRDEPDAGFKGFMLSVGNYYMYYNFHIMQASKRRVEERFHTVNIAVVDKRSKEVVVDIQHKADFGAVVVRLAGGKRFGAMDSKEQGILDELRQANKPENFRSVNLINEGNLDKQYHYRNPATLGVYEEWQTAPMCSKPSDRNRLLVAVMKQPNTGFKSASQLDSVVRLRRRGLTSRKEYLHKGLNRSLKVKSMRFSAKYCPEGSSGVFYTDAFGEQLMSGAGPKAVRQYFKPGVEIVLDGRFEIVDKWNGMHGKGARGQLLSHGYGVDALVN